MIAVIEKKKFGSFITQYIIYITSYISKTLTYFRQQRLLLMTPAYRQHNS